MSNIKTGNYAKTDIRMLVVIHAEASVINEGQFGDGWRKENMDP